MAPIIVLSLIGVLVATFSDDPPTAGKSSGTGTSTAAGAAVTVRGGGLRVGTTIKLAGQPGGVSIGKRNVWTSVPDAGQLVRWTLASGAHATFKALGSPTSLSAGFRALWVAQSGADGLAQFNGDAGTQVGMTKLPGSPVATVFDQNDSSAWVADKSGAISHVAVGGQLVGTPGHSDPAATGIAWGEGWLWAANGAANGLVRVSLDGSGSSTAFAAGQHPVAVALNSGVWVANANGHVTRFNPQALKLTADLPVASQLDAIAATDPGRYVWAISKTQQGPLPHHGHEHPRRHGLDQVHRVAARARGERQLGVGGDRGQAGHRDSVLRSGAALACKPAVVWTRKAGDYCAPIPGHGAVWRNIPVGPAPATSRESIASGRRPWRRSWPRPRSPRRSACLRTMACSRRRT